MDPGARARHDLLIVALALAGCAPAVVAPRPARARPARVAPAPPAPPRNELVVLAPEQPSRGHAVGRYTVVITGNPAAARGWRGDAAFADGARFAATHTNRDGTPGPVLRMEKTRGAWRYVFVDASGRRLRAGRLEDCVACHALAPRDEVFITGTAP